MEVKSSYYTKWEKPNQTVGFFSHSAPPDRTPATVWSTGWAWRTSGFMDLRMTRWMRTGRWRMLTSGWRLSWPGLSRFVLCVFGEWTPLGSHNAPIAWTTCWVIIVYSVVHNLSRHLCCVRRNACELKGMCGHFSNGQAWHYCFQDWRCISYFFPAVFVSKT